jgi:2-phospho-L-lactate guanylyltransferase
VRPIVLPVRSLDESKSRLEPVLSPLERGALTLAMLEDVLDVTSQIQGWESWVISPDEAVLEVAARRRARGIREEKPSLSNAIGQAEREATEAGSDAMAVLLPDTPLITTWGLTRALHTLGSVVIGPAADEVGTNLLVRRPPRAIRARFGPDSYRRHLQEAAEAGLPVSVVDEPGIAFDLDAEEDILDLLRADRVGRTLEVCLDMDLAARISTG